MAWLDAVRAVAALLVVYEHLTVFLLGRVRAVTAPWLLPGVAGVWLFFLVSGYIIPASLERHGSQRAFWLSRLFRLFPLYLAVAVFMVVLDLAGVARLNPYLGAHRAVAVLAHATMLPAVLGLPLVLDVFWTLTYEMIFYLLVSGLFVLRLHRSSGLLAVAMVAVTLVTVPASTQLLTATPAAIRDRTVVTAAVLVLGLLAVTSGRRWLTVPGAVALIVMAGALVLSDRNPDHRWNGLLFPAVMFVGTVIHRADTGQIRWRRAAAVICAVGAGVLIVWHRQAESYGAEWASHRTRPVITLLVFSGFFALGMVIRRLRVPRILAWVGRISYSVYLVHWGLLLLFQPVFAQATRRLSTLGQIPVAAAFLLVLLGVSWITYRLIELPGQRLGRRLTAWLAARWGSGAVPVERARPADPSGATSTGAPAVPEARDGEHPLVADRIRYR